MTQTPTIADADLTLTVAAFPEFLAEEVTAWVRLAETRGARFVSALAAVTQAMEAVADGTTDRTPLPADVPLRHDLVESALKAATGEVAS